MLDDDDAGAAGAGGAPDYNDDPDDPVEQAIPVYLSQELAHSLYLLQYPLRPFDRPYTDSGSLSVLSPSLGVSVLSFIDRVSHLRARCPDVRFFRLTRLVDCEDSRQDETPGAQLQRRHTRRPLRPRVRSLGMFECDLCETKKKKRFHTLQFLLTYKRHK